MFEILKPEQFCAEVVALRDETDMSLLDSILEVCTRRNIDVLVVPSLLTHDVREQLREEAISLHLLLTSPKE